MSQTTGQLLDYLRHDGTGKFVLSVIDGAYHGDVNRIDGNISRKDVVAAARGEHVGDLVRGLYAEACAQDASRCAGVDDRVIAAIEATVRQAARHLEYTDNAWEGIDDERSFWESNGKAILKVAVIGVAVIGCGAVSAGTAAVACGAVAGTATNWSMHAIDGDYRFTVGDAIAGGIGAATAGAGRFARLRNARGAPRVTPALRQAYVDDVASIADEVAAWQKAGADPELIAREAWANRRALGIQYKNITPADELARIQARNLKKYGDPLGPSIEWLRSRGRTWEQIIESATRTGGRDLGY
jgi:hypothetical protein